MSIKPILFDKIKAGDYKSTLGKHAEHYLKSNSIGMKLALRVDQAVPFVIDTETVKLAQAVRNEFIMHDKWSLIESALVPFDTTWIEYDPRAKLPPEKVHYDTADKVGHLLLKFEDSITVITYEQWHKITYMVPFLMTWTTDPNGVHPVIHHIGTKGFARELKETEWFRATVLTGRDKLPWWSERVGGNIFQAIAKTNVNDEHIVLTAEMMTVIQEHAGSLSMILGILSVLANCPRNDRIVSPSGRWLANHSHSRPYSSHTVVRIETSPRIAYKHIANGLREAVKKAQHDVREHWRVIRRGKPDEYRVRVSSHKRGDPSIGIITHDRYETVHIKRDHGYSYEPRDKTTNEGGR